MMIDTRLAIYLIWGGGVLVVFGIVFVKRVQRFRRHRSDRRIAVRRESRRDVLTGFALLLTAFGASAATFLVLFGQAGTGLRMVGVALALGAFLGAGFVMATEEDAG